MVRCDHHCSTASSEFSHTTYLVGKEHGRLLAELRGVVAILAARQTFAKQKRDVIVAPVSESEASPPIAGRGATVRWAPTAMRRPPIPTPAAISIDPNR